MSITKSGAVNSAAVHLKQIQADMAQLMAGNAPGEGAAPQDDGVPPPTPGTTDFDSTGDTINFGDGVLDGSTSSDQLGQSFTTDASSGQIDDLQLYLYSNDPSDGGTITASLWSDSGNSPGTEIGVLGTLDDSALTTSPALYDIALTGNPTVDPSTRYWIEVNNPSNNLGNDVWLGTGTLNGPEAGSEFIDLHGAILADHFGGAFMMSVTTEPPPCYAAGTRILTDRGEVAVENLQAGDRVIALRRGRLATVRWVGQRTVDIRRHNAPEKVKPVRIRAGAFAPGEPHRDLVVSPDHALFVDGSLVVARHLINGATVVQESPDRITYYHVELDAHDVLLAEGLPAETYLDTGNRAAFENGGAPVMAHPDFERPDLGQQLWRDKACAPTLDTPAQRAPLRQRLLARAGELGHVATNDPDLRLLAGGRILRPVMTACGARFDLPPQVASVRLLSRTARGCETMPNSMDMRCLGICVHQIALDGESVALNHPLLSAGWHDKEAIWRWTDGDAQLEIGGARTLLLKLCGELNYWAVEPACEPRAAFISQ
jgi:hypothetical protein